MLTSQQYSAGSSESEVEVFPANNSTVFGGTMLRMKCNPIVLSLRAPCFSFSTQGSTVEPKVGNWSNAVCKLVLEGRNFGHIAPLHARINGRQTNVKLGGPCLSPQYRQQYYKLVINFGLLD